MFSYLRVSLVSGGVGWGESVLPTVRGGVESVPRVSPIYFWRDLALELVRECTVIQLLGLRWGLVSIGVANYQSRFVSHKAKKRGGWLGLLLFFYSCILRI